MSAIGARRNFASGAVQYAHCSSTDICAVHEVGSMWKWWKITRVR